ncbi:hypothetical protein A3H53_04885 [Candidatus Nomurabacteria bacterium RIFCSPLOWO2_02_FULL_40_10]|uniref:Type 4 fimbrial biogenesis protein PilX N-terminal domain-containing protein n=1 Tax=Candidatus Nomurabacteria bacterium RIFCSPLOWO2_02_FULL_40_10 TaxID=1801786 RepID=A0A1F6XW08_9BACT|nr:MAG: hypothetical protein A3H53_04885 [Candidatus Nomurabacteria bacterium RIFCSPLOWO2_02_FULL_40_10]
MNQNKGQAPYNNCDKADTISLRDGNRLRITSGSDNRCHSDESTKNRNRSCATGQVMLLTVVLLSGAVLASTSLASLLILYQLRQATDAKGSMKAVFAADAGIEWAFYNENKLGGALPYPNSGPNMTNDSKVTITKNAADPFPLKAIGQSGRSARAFQASLPPAP